MRVVFLHARQDPDLAEAMIETAKPFGYRMVQLTDEETPAVKGVDEVIRLPWDGKSVMTFKLRHLMMLKGPFLAVDTDIAFQRDVSDVMQRPFDVALTRRKGPILDESGFDVTVDMPFNCGVMFSKDRRFWFEAYRICKQFPAEAQAWYGDQIAVKMVYDQGRLKILELDCAEYNYTPSSAREDVSKRAIIHYKGKRKAWLLNMRPAYRAERSFCKGKTWPR